MNNTANNTIDTIKRCAYGHTFLLSCSQYFLSLTHEKIIIITAPSGSGKTTLVKRLLAANPQMAFSISACTRQPRPGEVNGRDYHFYTEEEFRNLVHEDAFVEWEMVYIGKYYGTLKSEIQRIWDEGKTPVVDIDVKGALTIKDKYPYNSLSIFIKAPSTEELKRRLENRNSESAEMIKERLDKAEYELSFAPRFDKTIVNDDLDRAAAELNDTVISFLNS